MGAVIQRVSSQWAARLSVVVLACLAYRVARNGPHARRAAGGCCEESARVLQAVSAAWVWWGDEAESAEKGCMDPYTHRHTRRALYHPGQQGSKQGLSALSKPEPLLSCRRDQQAACLPARP